MRKHLFSTITCGRKNRQFCHCHSPSSQQLRHSLSSMDSSSKIMSQRMRVHLQAVRFHLLNHLRPRIKKSRHLHWFRQLPSSRQPVPSRRISRISLPLVLSSRLQMLQRRRTHRGASRTSSPAPSSSRRTKHGWGQRKRV